MAADTFTPPINPSPGLTEKPELKILQAEFGDGFSQPTPDGLNHIRRVIDLTWDVLEQDEMEAIRDFLEEHGGTEAFRYTLPNEAISRLYRCAEWQVIALQVDLYSISATFRQTFGAQA
jgi:phage-related protein